MRNYPCDSFQRLNAPSSIFEDLEAAEEAIEDALECKEIKEVMENYFDNIFISFCYSFKLCQRYTSQAENSIYLALSIPKKSCDSFATIDT